MQTIIQIYSLCLFLIRYYQSNATWCTNALVIITMIHINCGQVFYLENGDLLPGWKIIIALTLHITVTSLAIAAT